MGKEGRENEMCERVGVTKGRERRVRKKKV